MTITAWAMGTVLSEELAEANRKIKDLRTRLASAETALDDIRTGRDQHAAISDHGRRINKLDALQAAERKRG